MPVLTLEKMLYLPFVLLLGWFGGQAINYFSDVLPQTRRPGLPQCPVCGVSLSFREFFLQPYRYNTCGHRRPSRTWLVQVASVLICGALFLSPSLKLDFLRFFLILLYFGVVAVIDIENKLILHPVSIVGVILCGWIGWERHGIFSTLAGGVCGFVGMLTLYLLGALFARWAIKRRNLPPDEVALGFGDVNLSGVIGLLLGFPGILPGLVLAILLGGAASLFYLAWMFVSRRYQRFAAIPYGPFLILAAVLLLFQ